MATAHIRAMTPQDIPRVVTIHMEAFPSFFLTFLGPRFLHELYIAIASTAEGIAYIYQVDDRVKGFVVGTEQAAGFYRHLIRYRWWRFAWASLFPLLRCPTILPRLLRALRKPADVDASPHLGTLMSIAVDPRAQGSGIGGALVQAFLKEAIDRGCQVVSLTTDKHHNDPVNSFYQKLGFVLRNSYLTPEGREMNEYIIEL